MKKIVFLHGGPGLTPSYLLDFLNYLKVNTADRAELECFTMPNHNINSQESISINRFIEELITGLSLSFEGYSERIVVAHSFAGTVIANAIKEVHYTKLLLVSTPLFKGENFALNEKLKKIKGIPNKILTEEDFHQYFKKILPLYFQKLDAYNEVRDSILSKTSWIVNRDLQNINWNINKLLANMNKENIFYIYGEQDLILPNQRKEITSIFHENNVHAIKQCGHFPMYEQKDEFVKIFNSLVF